MTGRVELPEISFFRYRKDRKIKHVECIFYISDVSYSGHASCKFCGKAFIKKT
jgi:hypothetical protein